MNELDWVKEFPAAITVCDEDGILLEMNDKAVKSYEEEGGRKLIGSNVLACHPESARIKTEGLLADRQKNVYTIEKNGVKKLIYQSPWYRNDQYAGFVELALETPFELPHFIRS
jgi:transcriptional regulator with PAS, ATPase and Fis domain